MKWPTPIPYPSPSPPVTMTWRSGFASFAPSATGSARPWIAWNPYVERKCGKLLEHPIPETTRMFHGSSWSAWIDIWSARRTAKSPQPGHHVGLISDLYVSISNSSFTRPPPGSYPNVPPGERLAVVLPEEVVRFVSGLRPEETRELARVVPLDREALLHVLEEAQGRLGVEWEEGRELQAVHPDTARFDVLDRLVGRAPGRPPMDQSEVRVLWPPQLGRRRILPKPVQLPHPLLMHSVALRDVLRNAREDVGDEFAVLHVLIRCRNELVSFHAGDCPGTHAALCEEVTLEVLHFRAIRG